MYTTIYIEIYACLPCIFLCPLSNFVHALTAKEIAFAAQSGETSSIGSWNWFMWHTMWGPQTIAKLVHITPISLWFMVRKERTSYISWFINQLTTRLCPPVMFVGLWTMVTSSLFAYHGNHSEIGVMFTNLAIVWGPHIVWHMMNTDSFIKWHMDESWWNL